ncbi:hypothetical protein BD289DRAFT_5073 [Coniella lustricola]|uniref:Uncharacterized protein n=1 Tax=Coniella lustricola TaxID=2025994 RepID=A0A2T3ANT8_9PEZI|nr:hypothetical protein BD289DRAFT_5073 [Coniella lustricola]
MLATVVDGLSHPVFYFQVHGEIGATASSHHASLSLNRPGSICGLALCGESPCSVSHIDFPSRSLFSLSSRSSHSHHKDMHRVTVRFPEVDSCLSRVLADLMPCWKHSGKGARRTSSRTFTTCTGCKDMSCCIHDAHRESAAASFKVTSLRSEAVTFAIGRSGKPGSLAR